MRHPEREPLQGAAPLGQSPGLSVAPGALLGLRQVHEPAPEVGPVYGHEPEHQDKEGVLDVKERSEAPRKAVEDGEEEEQDEVYYPDAGELPADHGPGGDPFGLAPLH